MMAGSPVRLLALGEVSPVRSQTIYHAVGEAMEPGSPDTIILVSPTHPYVCVGFHQDPLREVDMDRCQSLGLPVYRRQVGGGAVYLDAGQVFVQWVFHPANLPPSLDDQFSLYVEPLVETYRAFGIEAYLRPVNDVHVDGKKIGGTGAADIGDGRVLVGSLMFDFDKRTMADVLNVPSEKMRDKVFESLETYMTTMVEQLGESPPRSEVIARYVVEVARALGRTVEAGSPTDRELEVAGELDRTFLDPEWLFQKSPMRSSGVKIHGDVHVFEGVHKASGGLVRATVRMSDGFVDDVTFTGDFTVLPAQALATLERAARGARAEGDELQARFDEVFAESSVDAPGLTPHDLEAAVLAALGESDT